MSKNSTQKITMRFSTLEAMLRLAIIEGQQNPERDSEIVFNMVQDDIKRSIKEVNNVKG